MPVIALIDKNEKKCFFISSVFYEKYKIPMLINILKTYILSRYPHKYKIEVLERSDGKINNYYTEVLTDYRTNEIIETALKYIKEKNYEKVDH